MRNIFLILLFISSLFSAEHLTVENMQEKLKNKNAIVDFYATWCPPCKIMGKNLNKFEKVKDSSVEVLKVDVDEQKQIAIRYGIRTIPTLIYFKDGKFVKKEVGIKTVSQLKANVKELF